MSDGSTPPRPVMLVVMDGWGLREARDHNAVRLADTPRVDALCRDWPYATLKTSGRDVGLPDGQMGNSEVGHLNLGAGRVVWQDISRIDNAIENGSFFTKETFLGAVDHALQTDARLHLMGLVSDGGVHSSDRHYKALLDLCARQGLTGERVAFHCFMDGRDTPPHGGRGYIADLEAHMASCGAGAIATVGGRYHAMDRDKRWPRVERAWRAIADGEGVRVKSASEAIESSYADDVTDEFVVPRVIVRGDRPVARLCRGDAVLFFNFRADRARQITHAMLDPEFPHFERREWPLDLHYATMTHYEDGVDVPEAFPPIQLDGLIGDVAAAAGRTQVRMAETEKYPHVTFFFNGGQDAPRDGEQHCLVPSPQVATYDLQPEMSARELTEKARETIRAGTADLIVLNYANGDMVGHTGVLEAAIKAVQTVDEAVGRIADAVLEAGGAMLVTADHGNCEQMWDPATNGPHTAHTTNDVPCFLVGGGFETASLRAGGRLADVAPTLLDLMGLSPSPEMTGQSLLVRDGSA